MMMDIVEEMRGFEVDHEPDGWPAVKMKQVSALCDEIDALRAELQKAREQEPVIQIENGMVVNFNPNYDGDISNGEFYAAPVPAMPIPNQEPAGAVPDADSTKKLWDLFKKTDWDAIAKALDFAKSVAQNNSDTNPSPRITEQDAREIIEDYIGYCDGKCLNPQSSVVMGMYIKNECTALLNKLNANAVPSQAAAMPEKMTRAEAIEKSKEYPAPKHEDRDYDKLFARCCHLERLLLGL